MIATSKTIPPLSPIGGVLLTWWMPGLTGNAFTVGDIRSEVMQKRDVFWEAFTTYDDLVLIGNHKTIDYVVKSFQILAATTDLVGFYVCEVADKYSPDDRLSFRVKRYSGCHAVAIEDWGKQT